MTPDPGPSPCMRWVGSGDESSGIGERKRRVGDMEGKKREGRENGGKRKREER